MRSVTCTHNWNSLKTLIAFSLGFSNGCARTAAAKKKNEISVASMVCAMDPRCTSPMPPARINLRKSSTTFNASQAKSELCGAELRPYCVWRRTSQYQNSFL